MSTGPGDRRRRPHASREAAPAPLDARLRPKGRAGGLGKVFAPLFVGGGGG